MSVTNIGVGGSRYAIETQIRQRVGFSFLERSSAGSTEIKEH